MEPAVEKLDPLKFSKPWEGHAIKSNNGHVHTWNRKHVGRSLKLVTWH